MHVTKIGHLIQRCTDPIGMKAHIEKCEYLMSQATMRANHDVIHSVISRQPNIVVSTHRERMSVSLMCMSCVCHRW